MQIVHFYIRLSQKVVDGIQLGIGKVVFRQKVQNMYNDVCLERPAIMLRHTCFTLMRIYGSCWEHILLTGMDLEG